jgi:hypothetical protein
MRFAGLQPGHPQIRTRCYAVPAGKSLGHRGIGLTGEDPAHLYLERATASGRRFGDPTAHRAPSAEGIGV